MAGYDRSGQVVSRRWLPFLSPLAALGTMVVLAALGVRAVFWFSSPPDTPHQEEQPIAKPVSTNLPPYALPSDVAKALGEAESLVIYLVLPGKDTSGKGDSMDPAQAREAGKDTTFHGYSIVGRAHIKSPKEVRRITESLLRGVEKNGREPFGCWFPWHGVRALESDGRWVDLVICYHCQRMEVYSSTEPVEVFTAADSRKYMNGALKAAGVDLKRDVGPGIPQP